MMRAAFSEALVGLARADPDLLLLTGDHGYALFDDFRLACPDQYINAGVAEQNMVGMAAGLARMGFRPVVYGLSAFVPIRVLEQIKLDVAHDGLPVIFIGDGAGFVYGHLGTSHQSTEDVACTRAIPNLAVYSPGDRFETTLCMQRAYASAASVYLRLGKADRGDVHAALPAAETGAVLSTRGGTPGGPCLIASGSMLRTAMDLAESNLKDATVYSAPFLKPIDASQLADILAAHPRVAVLEEHSVFGGLGAIVAEVAAETAQSKLLRIGVQDRFSEHCGSYDYLLREHGLDAVSVLARLNAFFD